MFVFFFFLNNIVRVLVGFANEKKIIRVLPMSSRSRTCVCVLLIIMRFVVCRFVDTRINLT